MANKNDVSKEVYTVGKNPSPTEQYVAELRGNRDVSKEAEEWVKGEGASTKDLEPVQKVDEEGNPVEAETTKEEGSSGKVSKKGSRTGPVQTKEEGLSKD